LLTPAWATGAAETAGARASRTAAAANPATNAPPTISHRRARLIV
jgi:hypothetical protein